MYRGDNGHSSNRHKVGFKLSCLEEETPASGREGDETLDADFNGPRMAVRTLTSAYTSKRPAAGYLAGSDLD
jgi:hypothetical protein